MVRCINVIVYTLNKPDLQKTNSQEEFPSEVLIVKDWKKTID